MARRAARQPGVRGRVVLLVRGRAWGAAGDWAAKLAAALPPLSRSQAISVARIAARLDASSVANTTEQEH